MMPCCDAFFRVLHPHHLVRIVHGGRRARECFLVVVLGSSALFLLSFWRPSLSLFNPQSSLFLLVIAIFKEQRGLRLGTQYWI